MNTAFAFCNKALVAGLQHLMCPPHTSQRFLLRGNLNKHIDIVSRARLNTFPLFTWLHVSFLTPFLSLLQPQILLSNLVLSVTLETNPTPPQCSQFLPPLCSHPRKLHCCTFMLGENRIWATLFFQSNYLKKDMLCLLY